MRRRECLLSEMVKCVPFTFCGECRRSCCGHVVAVYQCFLFLHRSVCLGGFLVHVHVTPCISLVRRVPPVCVLRISDGPLAWLRGVGLDFFNSVPELKVIAYLFAPTLLAAMADSFTACTVVLSSFERMAILLASCRLSENFVSLPQNTASAFAMGLRQRNEKHQSAAAKA